MLNVPEINYHEPPREFTKKDGTRWRRTGYCCQCGDCCESGDPFTGKLGTCPLLLRVDPARAFCTDKTNYYRKIACDHWPSDPKQLAAYPRCTYKFERA